MQYITKVYFFTIVSCTNYPTTTSPHSSNATSSIVMVDNRKPHFCNSPGWDENPSDIKVLTGAYVYYNCRNKLSYNKTKWLIDGRNNVLQSKYSSRVNIQNNGETLRFGPVLRSDDGIGINCEVYTYYGYLPSPLGTIRVICKYTSTVCHIFILLHNTGYT